MERTPVLFVSFSPSPFERSSAWGYVIGFSAIQICSLSLLQVGVQRYNALPTLQDAKQYGTILGTTIYGARWRVFTQTIPYNDNLHFVMLSHNRCFLFAMLTILVIQSLFCAAGVVAFAYFTKIGCDPLANGDITNKNQVQTHERHSKSS